MRVLRWTAGIFALLVVAAILFVFFGLNTLRGPISRAVSSATGRELLIEGDLKPVWSWVHPRIRAEGVSFANADWAQEDDLLKADSIELSVSVLPLFAGRIVLPEVHLEHAEVALEIDAEGRKNWILKSDQTQRESRIRIHRLTLDHGKLIYDDAGRDTSLRAELDTDSTGVAFKTDGKYNGLPVTASGHGGSVLALRDATSPYPLKAQAKIGETAVKVDGAITELAELSGIDMAIELSGKSMEELYDVVGVAFPTTSPYSTSGRLVREGSVVRYEKFTGKVGKSDLAGTLQVDISGERPFMQGDLNSKVLDLADLGPVVGTQKPHEAGVLPDAPFDAKRWKSVDADVKLRAGTIRRPEQLPLEHLATRIKMRDAVLTLDPLEFGTAGGKLAGTIRLDGREPTIRADAKIRVQNLQLGKLFPTIDLARASVGDLSGAIELSGSGNSVARMLGSANGKIGLFMERGEVSELMMQMVAIDLWGITKVKLKGDEPVPIRCMVGDFGVKNGRMEANALVFDTQIVNVGGSGRIDLRQETLDLTLLPEPKDPSLASLRSPLYIRGTFSAPTAAPDMKTIATRGAGALVMGILNPLLAVVPLIDQGPGKDSDCGKLIAEITSSTRTAATASSQSASSGGSRAASK